MEKKGSSFEFVSYVLEDKHTVALNYAVVFSEDKRLEFCEKITIPEGEMVQSASLDRVLYMLHLICGMSYWKTYCPSSIIIRTKELTKSQAAFWDTVYTKGLGEFFFRNKIDYRGLIHFPYNENMTVSPLSIKTQERALISVGGGKDSIVTYELLKEANIPVSAFILETQKEYGLINEVIREMNAPAIKIKRVIDPLLFEVNKREGVYNGHVPITALYSVIGLLCAILFEYKYIVMSNERSANYGNVEYLGEEVNHQWSKSSGFEEILKKYINETITPDISYFSLLRPFSEIRVVKEFVNFPKYFPVFSSCNNNFKIYNESGARSRWCGHCPKCAFVFSMLAAYLSKTQLVQIFGKDLYADPNLLDSYKELLGVKNYKPFECVGTPFEVKAAFYEAYKKGEYKNDVVMKMFEMEVLPIDKTISQLLPKILLSTEDCTVPDTFKDLVI